jgi:hypothetical protein
MILPWLQIAFELFKLIRLHAILRILGATYNRDIYRTEATHIPELDCAYCEKVWRYSRDNIMSADDENQEYLRKRRIPQLFHVRYLLQKHCATYLRLFFDRVWPSPLYARNQMIISSTSLIVWRKLREGMLKTFLGMLFSQRSSHCLRMRRTHITVKENHPVY